MMVEARPALTVRGRETIDQPCNLCDCPVDVQDADSAAGSYPKPVIPVTRRGQQRNYMLVGLRVAQIEGGKVFRLRLSGAQASNMFPRGKPDRVISGARHRIDIPWQGAASAAEKIRAARVRTQPQQAVLGGDENRSALVHRKRLVTITQSSCFGRQFDRFEALPKAVRNPLPRPNPQAAIRRGQNKIHEFARKSLRAPKACDPVSVITKKTRFRANPQKALAVLRHTKDSCGAQAKALSEMLYGVVWMVG